MLHLILFGLPVPSDQFIPLVPLFGYFGFLRRWGVLSRINCLSFTQSISLSSTGSLLLVFLGSAGRATEACRSGPMWAFVNTNSSVSSLFRSAFAMVLKDIPTRTITDNTSSLFRACKRVWARDGPRGRRLACRFGSHPIWNPGHELNEDKSWSCQSKGPGTSKLRTTEIS